MAKKQIQDGLASLRGRIRWYLQHLWGGSQARMGKEIGISRGALSNVLTGRRQPGREIIAAIAKHPAVNPSWLLTGEGDALLADVMIATAGETALPVAAELFEGLPEQNGDKLQPHLMAVPRRLSRASRYWIRVDSDNPLVHTELKLAAGDYVLMEPDRTGWPRDIEHCPCITRDSEGKLAWATPTTLLSSPTITVPTETYRYIDASGGIQKSGEPSPPPKASAVPPNQIIAVGIYRVGGFSSRSPRI